MKRIQSKRWLKQMGVVALIVATMAMFAGPLATPSSAGESREYTAWRTDSNGNKQRCTFTQSVFNPRYSFNNPTDKVVGRAGWRVLSGPCTQAKVTTQLQVSECASLCKWKTAAKSTRTIGQGSFTVTNKCGRWPTGPHYWRTRVDVDVIGFNDPAQKTRTSSIKINCAD